jgi:hypothetical protein
MMSVSQAAGRGKAVTLLERLADAKRLPADFLRELGLDDLPEGGVGIPYYDVTGQEIAVKRRTALKATDGSYWPKGTPLAAYGQWRLDAAAKAGFLILVEGESDCWALWYHQLPALGIPGANAAKTLEREHVEAVPTLYVHREPDDGGAAFVKGVASRLAAIGFDGKAFELRMPDGVKDPADLHAAGPEAFKARLEEAILQSAPLERPRPTDRNGQAQSPKRPPPAPPTPYLPFPILALPEPARSYVAAGAKAIGCDPAYVALPLMTSLASAIGNSRCVELKRGWTEPAITWTAIVGYSGTLKSPALDLALRPVRDRQAEAIRGYRQELAEYEAAQEEYKAALEEWKRSKKGTARPEKPEGDPPVCERLLVSDTTVESLALLLQDAPRGLLLGRDELSGWLGSFDAYKAKGKGGDVAHWLEMHRAGHLLVDRKSGPVKIIHVPRAAVSIAGSIQPETLRRALGLQHFENGLAARLLVALPPRRPKRWTELEVDPDLEEDLARVFERLYSLELVASDDAEPRPVTLRLTAEAKQAWRSFYDAHADEQAALTGDLAAAWSKLEGYAARLALVIQCVAWAAVGEPASGPDAVGLAAIESGIVLSRWFGQEARRVYAALAESEEERDRHRLLELIQRRGGRITARELMQGDRRFRDSADAAEVALQELVGAGLGTWEPVSPTDWGGRPTGCFRLSTDVYVYGTPEIPEESGGFVDVDSVDTPESAEAAAEEYGGEL